LSKWVTMRFAPVKVPPEMVEPVRPAYANVAPVAVTSVNVSETAGQTVEHAHIHLVPRFHGDVEDPRGGIRWVIPDKAAYWD